jgi:SAM-dependent methyltransferase
MGLMSKVPWWAKLGLKLLLSRLPLSYCFWQRAGLFRHGNMDDPGRAIRTFEKYYHLALAHGELPVEFSSLELGPGDSILSGIVARAYGAGSAWLVDAGSFADTNVDACRVVARELRTQEKVLPSIEHASDIGEVLHLLNVSYLTDGAQSLAKISDASIDFFWSQVVLEHVPREGFLRFLKHLRRIAKPDAIGVHSIDFRDHLSGGLNNLRFSKARWEGVFFRNAGFYTNRLRPREMLAMFSMAGFSVDVLAEVRWPEMPIRRDQLASEFQVFSDEDFMVAEIEVLLRPCHD